MIELLTLWAVFSGFFCLGRAVADEGRGYPFDEPKKGRIKTNLNAVALTLNIYDYLKTVDYHKLITPKTPIQKEIEAELKEIKQIERQKKDIDLLKDLKNRRKRLFKEVDDCEVEREKENVICDSCGNYMNYRGIDRSRREVYECKSCNLTLKTPLITKNFKEDKK